MTLSTASLFEIIFVDVAALFLTVATLWVLLKITPGDELRDTRSFFVLIIAIVPFVMLIYLGPAVISYDAIVQRSGLPARLPLESLGPPEIFAGAVIYIGLTLWLWWRWRKLRAD
jgi:heme A synthase